LPAGYRFHVGAFNPHASTDSVAGIRFVNLSPVTSPVSVDIKGLSNGSEVTSLPYKAGLFSKHIRPTALSPAIFLNSGMLLQELYWQLIR